MNPCCCWGVIATSCRSQWQIKGKTEAIVSCPQKKTSFPLLMFFSKQTRIHNYRGKRFLELPMSINKISLYICKDDFRGCLLICWNLLDSTNSVIKVFSLEIVSIIIVYSEPRRANLDGTKSLTWRIWLIFLNIY